MATSKPEVLTIQAVSEIETRFWWLHLGFRGRPEEWNIDRHRNVHARYRIFHGDVETGILTTQAVSKIETRFRRLHLGFRGRPDDGTSTDTEICTRHADFNMATSKPEVLIPQIRSKIEM